MAEWEHLVHFHVGQLPTIEYLALGCDHDWVNIAFKDMVPCLAKNYPYESTAWTEWKAKAPVSPVGRWSVAGHWPGKGSYAGVMEVKAGDAADRYTVVLDGAWADGSAIQGSGQALVYTGYEWRADMDIGGDHTAARQGADTQVLALQPAHIRVGETATLRIVCTGLDDEVRLPLGLKNLTVGTAPAS